MDTRSSAFALALAAACSTTRVLDRPPTAAQVAEANADLDDRQVEVQLAGDTRLGRELQLGLLETTWRDASGRKQAVPNEALESVRYHRHAAGALEGMGIGILIGAAAGATAGFVSGDDTCPQSSWCIFRLSAGQKAAFGALALGVLGIVPGVLFGAAVGHTEVLLFSPKPQASN